MDVALLVLRLVVGTLFAGHGAQKLFGWFGGHGPRGTASFFESLGFRPARPLALFAGFAELAGGLLLASGLAVPLAALLLVGVMAAAIASVHWRNGVWNTDGGIEFPLVMAAVVFAVAAAGPGAYALEALLGVEWSGVRWAVLAAAIGAIAGVGAYAFGRARPLERPETAVPKAA